MYTYILKSQQNHLAEILGFNQSFCLCKKQETGKFNFTDVFTCIKQLLEGLIFLRNVKRRKTSFSTLWTPKTKVLYDLQGLTDISITHWALIA